MTKLSKRHQSLPKVAIIGLSLSVVVAVSVMAIGIYAYRAITADDRARQHLESGISMLPIPAGCTERDRSYSKSDVDAVSTYSLSYECDTSGAAAHDAIVTNLNSQGFTTVNDFSLPDGAAKGAFYSFSYGNQNYKVTYRFLPETTIELKSQSIDQLHESRVTEIVASLTSN